MPITSNISHTHRILSNRDETDDVEIDGDMDGAMFRTLVDVDSWEEFEDFVEDELPVGVRGRTYTPYGYDVQLA